jgi:hypothetical protein
MFDQERIRIQIIDIIDYNICFFMIGALLQYKVIRLKLVNGFIGKALCQPIGILVVRGLIQGKIHYNEIARVLEPNTKGVFVGHLLY